MDVEWIMPYREAFPWSARAGHALAALVGGALYTRLAVSQRRLPHQQQHRRAASAENGGLSFAAPSETAVLALDLLLLLPVLAVNTVLPFCFDSNGDELLSRLALAFMATWLGSFKAIGAALGRGPLAQAPWTPGQYVLLYAAPVYPSAGCTGGTVPAPKASSASVPASSASPPRRSVSASPKRRAGAAPPPPAPAAAAPSPPRLQGRLADDAGSLAELLLALLGNATVLGLCAYALVRYDIPPWPRSYVYALGLYGFVCVLMGVPATMIRGALGVTLVPPFDKPWLCHSVADYWGRRWNNTTSLHLRSLVYDIVAEGRWVRLGGHAMAAVGGGGAGVGVGAAAANGNGNGAAANGGGAAAADGAGAAAATNAAAPIVVTARRLGSAGGLLGSYLSSANLAELAVAAGSRPGSPAGGAGVAANGNGNAANGNGSGNAKAPPTTPAGNTRSRARAAATATVTIASFDLEKKYPTSLRERAAARLRPLALRGDNDNDNDDGDTGNGSAFAAAAYGGGGGGGGSVSTASPSPVRNGGGGPASPLVALAPAPPPTQLRRDLGVFCAFFVSAVFHEIILYLVVPNAALGWWFAFFVLQAPLMVAERTALRWMRGKGVELPMLARRAFTTVLLLGVSRVFFFTPIEDKSDLAQRVAEAVTGNFEALGRGVGSLQRVVEAAAMRVF